MPRRPLRDDWADLSDEQLLDVRMADLPVAIEGTLAAMELRGLRPRRLGADVMLEADL